MGGSGPAGTNQPEPSGARPKRPRGFSVGPERKTSESEAGVAARLMRRDGRSFGAGFSANRSGKHISRDRRNNRQRVSVPRPEQGAEPLRRERFNRSQRGAAKKAARLFLWIGAGNVGIGGRSCGAFNAPRRAFVQRGVSPRVGSSACHPNGRRINRQRLTGAQAAAVGGLANSRLHPPKEERSPFFPRPAIQPRSELPPPARNGWGSSFVAGSVFDERRKALGFSVAVGSSADTVAFARSEGPGLVLLTVPFIGRERGENSGALWRPHSGHKLKLKKTPPAPGLPPRWG
jgi:hypothetical protein